MKQRWPSSPVLVISLALLYFAAAKLGLKLALVNPSATAVWPPTGIALAGCLLLGNGVWPGILLGAFLANVTTSGSIPTSLAIALGNTLEGLAGAYLVTRFAQGAQAFNRAQDIFKFVILAAGVSTTLSATLGVTSLAVSGLAAWGEYGPVWFTWWLGDATGAIIVAPLLILWAVNPRLQWRRRRALEAGLLVLALTGLGLAVFGGGLSLSGRHYPLEFTLLPLLVWAAYRFDQRAAATATVILSAIALWGTLHGFGPFVDGTANEALLLLQAFMATVAVTGLVLAAVVAERRNVEDALRQQRESLRLSRDQLGIILEHAADGIVAQDRDGRMRYANEAAARMIGYPSAQALLEAPRAEVIGRFELFDEAGQPLPIDRLPGRLALQGQSRASAIIRYHHRDSGVEHWSANQATPIFDSGGQVESAISILHDITELKRAELNQRLLAEAGRLLAASTDADVRLASVAQLVVPHLADWCSVFVVDDDDTIRPVAITHANAARADSVAKWQREPLTWDSSRTLVQVLRSGEALLIPEITEAHLRANAADEAQLQDLRRCGMKSALVVPLKARGRMLGVMTFVWAESGRRYGPADLALAEELASHAALAADNARLLHQAQALNAELESRVGQRTLALERSQAEARALSSRLLVAREEERAEIAREIHDELGQQLTGLKMDLARLSRAAGPQASAELHVRIRSMAELLDNTIQLIRRLATGLRPALLDDFGLLAALEWQIEDFQNRTGIACQLTVTSDPPPLPAETTTALFRVCQEALTNVARHAGAKAVEIHFGLRDAWLVVQVRDNGRGLAPDELSHQHSLGLAGMRERVRLIGGRLDIHSASGQGTTVTVGVPMSTDGAPGPIEFQANSAENG